MVNCEQVEKSRDNVAHYRVSSFKPQLEFQVTVLKVKVEIFSLRIQVSNLNHNNSAKPKLH